MSFKQSMSPPPPQKQPPPPYNSYPSAASPAGSSQGFAPPPAKRPRLSPDPRSPAQQNGMTPQYAPPVGGPGAYGNPYAPQPPAQSPYGSPSPYVGSPQSSFNAPQLHQQNQPQWYSQPPTPSSRQMSPQAAQAQTPQRVQSSQMMPPPPRPQKEEQDHRTRIDDINDPMHGSGVNLADEENYMHSFQTNQSTSFGSSANNSFNQLTQSFNNESQQQSGGAFQGTLGEPQSQEEIENQVKRKRADAARAKAEQNQHPMLNQFLQTGPLRTRIDRVCNANGVTMDVRGLYQRLPQPPQPQYRTNVMMNEKEGIASTSIDNRPEYTAGRGENWEQLASLLCLATGERLRGLMDESFALARARRFGDHGRVPPEFLDIAVGQGERREEEVRPESITGTQWDKVPDTASSPAANGDQLPNGTDKPSTPQPQPTISFADSITARLREVEKRDRDAEEARIRKREARRKKAAENAQSSEEAAAAAAAETPAPEESSAPQVKVSKKEQERQKKEANKQAEANVHQTTNQTAALMALGGSKKMKKYSWMTGGASAMPTNRFAPAKPASTNTSSPGATSPAAAVKTEGGSPAATGGQAMSRAGSQQQETKLPEWGDWREDGTEGRGIQARDWALVLERDGKEKKALQRVLNKLS
ncbi:hypothetical protein D0864_12732 [Hortaea werneckii]|uniref:Uncharacterized protein n=1 Tax=Hortaea werneckii TaxID=91943 RepID=A0A3M7DFH0_HORWE|nr:hypothetical protein KC338_g711 [Hortaea werneckii]KAI7359082.1 hypothetical protein KC320_g722 [Hortaea werneckii]RMY62940.1 hypothetical protein D0864_12732 [Hortaea werneckii]